MRVAILGCGYVGLQLVRDLVDAGHDAIGVRRSENTGIAAAGGLPIIGDLGNETTLERIPHVDTVVFTASSDGTGVSSARDAYVRGLRTTIAHFAARDRPPERLVYTSSTGVYGDHGGDWVDETTAIDQRTGRASVLADAERVARDAANDGLDATVVRVGGIYGPSRWGIERYLERPVVEGYRNHIHRDDVAGAIVHLLERGTDGHDTVLLVDDEPVHRWTFASWLATHRDRGEPTKITTEERLQGADLSPSAKRRLQASKRCDNGRLRDLGFDFRYPTYREGYAPVLNRAS